MKKHILINPLLVEEKTDLQKAVDLGLSKSKPRADRRAEKPERDPEPESRQKRGGLDEDPCEGVECGEGEICQNGVCVFKPGPVVAPPVDPMALVKWVLEKLYEMNPLGEYNDFEKAKDNVSTVTYSKWFEDLLFREGWFGPNGAIGRVLNVDDLTNEEKKDLDDIRRYVTWIVAALAVGHSGVGGLMIGLDLAEPAEKATKKAAAKGGWKNLGKMIRGAAAELGLSSIVEFFKANGLLKAGLTVLKYANNFANKGTWAGMLSLAFVGRKTAQLYEPLDRILSEKAKQRKALREANKRKKYAQRAEEKILEALEKGNYNLAAEIAEEMLTEGVVPEKVRFKLQAPAIEAAKQQWVFNFSKLVDGRVQETISIPRQIARETGEQWLKLTALADRIINPARKLTKEQKENNTADNALKVLIAKISEMNKGEEKLIELKNSGALDEIAQFFVEKEILEQYIKALELQDREYEKIISMINLKIDTNKETSDDLAGQQTSPDAPATAEPQTQTPVNENKIKITKSKLIDLISEQVKEQTQTIDVTKDQLVALVTEEAFKQINRKK